MIPEHVLAASTLANTQTVPPNSTVSLLKMASEACHARAWRITLQRMDRADRHAPLVPGGAGASVPIVQQAQYAYAAGQQTTPAWPPVRSNPVFGPTNPAATLIAQVAWGMDAANPARLAAHWPAQGASIVVVGSYVELAVSSQGVQDQEFDLQPQVSAQMAPWEGLPLDASGELSISGRIRVLPRQDGPPPTWGGASYVPDFARRVKVVLVQLDDTLGGATQSVPNNGDPTCQLGWFDDQGNEVDSAMQGRFFPPAAGTPLYTPPVWHEVPASAVLLAVRGDQNFDGFAIVHWRIAP